MQKNRGATAAPHLTQITQAGAAQIVADFRSKHAVDDCDMPALRAAQHPVREWTEERAIAMDLQIAAMKADGRYDLCMHGGRA
ncbi:hypothetical protein [Xylophilus sp. GOD-11R]|uniref:hypothetical protein n=1 Tax=Xylophilus sp. GOD-11R TaxID=3089814 RepID=UPI00298CB290|nr:hypothetical protein [Xylophilus sp. GOD-11R]WPB58609.1 hypothetical protein R9X41_08235 [Xylophilus sp. GOD-11R]